MDGDGWKGVGDNGCLEGRRCLENVGLAHSGLAIHGGKGNRLYLRCDDLEPIIVPHTSLWI